MRQALRELHAVSGRQLPASVPLGFMNGLLATEPGVVAGAAAKGDISGEDLRNEGELPAAPGSEGAGGGFKPASLPRRDDIAPSLQGNGHARLIA